MLFHANFHFSNQINFKIFPFNYKYAQSFTWFLGRQATDTPPDRQTPVSGSLGNVFMTLQGQTQSAVWPQSAVWTMSCQTAAKLQSPPMLQSPCHRHTLQHRPPLQWTRRTGQINSENIENRSWHVSVNVNEDVRDKWKVIGCSWFYKNPKNCLKRLVDPDWKYLVASREWQFYLESLLTSSSVSDLLPP